MGDEGKKRKRMCVRERENMVDHVLAPSPPNPSLSLVIKYSPIYS